jgi:ATP-dependent DNA helicase RecG
MTAMAGRSRVTSTLTPTAPSPVAAKTTGAKPAAKARSGNASKPASKTAPQPASDQPAASPAQRAMARLGLTRDIDLALHLPLRYEDETRVVTLHNAHEGDVVQVEVTVQSCNVGFRPRRQLVAHTRDEEGQALTLRFLNFYPSQQKQLEAGTRVRVRGELRGGFFGREMVHPVIRSATAPLPTVLTPVYPTTAQLPQATLRRAIDDALERAPLDEVLPPGTMPPGLPSLRDAVLTLHHPAPDASLTALQDREDPAWQRLKFDELLAQQLSQLESRERRALLRAPKLVRGAHYEQLLAALPFRLTAAQVRVVDEIAQALAREVPMHRLLQGDVGSGKTVVAALAACVAIDSGWQCALMAPTEILAEQHFRKLVEWLDPLGLGIAWLAGSRKGRERARMLEAVASGDAHLVVGTHAVIQDDVRFKRLGLAIVDEQHRFGVAQRLALRAKLEAAATTSTTSTTSITTGPADGEPPATQLKLAEPGTSLEPHLLMMSATPIPRTLAMTYFADLDVSTIDELPPGRTPVVTKLFADARRDQVIERIRDEVAQGRQVYWVCPLVEESEELDLRDATQAHATLAAALPDHRVGLVHGRLPSAEKAAVMTLFKQGQMALLVATTVIEVGVDVPNASLMVVDHAERFGLAQLHQLRGRVGRGAVASVCVLLYAQPLSQTARARLKAMVETTDGFEIARRDLEIRGPGEFLGARQSGDALLRFADLQADNELLQTARALAPRLLAEDPRACKAHVDRWLGGRAEFLKA